MFKALVISLTLGAGGYLSYDHDKIDDDQAHQTISQACKDSLHECATQLSWVSGKAGQMVFMSLSR